MSSRFRSAVFLQFMGTVGSGIFVLPYLFQRSNIIFATIFLVFLTLITAGLNHFYVDIVRSTLGDHQLTGYTKIYLGAKYQFVTSLNLILLSLGAIIAYSKLFQSFFALLFPHISPLSPVFYLFLLFFLFYFNQKVKSNIFIFIPILILIIPIVLFFLSANSPYESISQSFLISPSFAFYGALLFALSGFTIIPEVRETLGSNRRFPLAVFFGLVLAAIIYLFYIFSVIRLSGPNLSINSVSGIVSSHPSIGLLLSFFGLIITLRASANFLQILRELFYRDIGFSSLLSVLLPLLFPLIAFTFGSLSLLTVISLTGHFTIFISALIICLIRFRLPHSFWTQFLCLLILISLFFGLVGAIIN